MAVEFNQQAIADASAAFIKAVAANMEIGVDIHIAAIPPPDDPPRWGLVIALVGKGYGDVAELAAALVRAAGEHYGEDPAQSTLLSKADGFVKVLREDRPPLNRPGKA